MSSKEAKEKAKKTMEDVTSFLREAKKAAHEELSKEAPKASEALDKAFKTASKSLADALRATQEKTSKEQLELLRAYRSFLQKQVDLIDKRIESAKE
jgi:phosphate uptake regulator